MNTDKFGIIGRVIHYRKAAGIKNQVHLFGPRPTEM